MKNLKKIIPIMTLLLLANNAIAKTRFLYNRFYFGQSQNDLLYYKYKNKNEGVLYYPYGYGYGKDYYGYYNNRQNQTYLYNRNKSLVLGGESILIESDDDELKKELIN